LNFAPGSEHLYSNSGYFLLSLIIKRVTGKSLREFATENIFRPLAMTSAQFRDDHTIAIPNRAEGYAPRPNQTGHRVSNPNFDVVGAGGLFMSVRDFLAWDENFYAPKVGDNALIELLETPGRLNSGGSLIYAFGLNVSSFRGLRIVEHAGAYGGFRAHAIRFPERHFSVVCFTNLATMVPGQLVRRVAALYLGGVMQPEPPPTERTIGSAEAAAKATRVSSPVTKGSETRGPGDLTGDYFNEELQVTFRVAPRRVARRCNAATPSPSRSSAKAETRSASAC
jgi:CubicO group peptidase (beta-lactamase class C family)